MESHEKKPGSFFDNFQPKAAFILGLATGFGCFIMLYMFFNGVDLSAMGANKKAATNSNTNSAAAAVADSGEPTEVDLVPVSDADWVEGDRNAKVTIVEYSDLECPFCQRHHDTLKQVVENYKGQVNWVYRHYPLTSLHSKADTEAEASECAGELGGNDAFWAYIDRIFEITPTNNGLNLDELPNIAEYVGLDRAKFQECLDSGRHAEKVAQQTAEASLAGGQGTPYNVIVSGEEKIPVSGALPYEQFTSLIDSLLES